MQRRCSRSKTRRNAAAKKAPTSAQGAAPGCLHELFERQADLRGEAVALVCGAVTLTYSALELRANQVASYLRQAGVRSGALVGIAFDRSELPIIAVLGCLKAGTAYVPIDPAHPDERIRYILDEAATVALLTEADKVSRFSALSDTRIIALDDTALEAVPATRLSPAEIGLSPHDLCYIIYTSGTTGRPKGVMTEHRNAVHFVKAFNKVCITTAADRIYQGFSLGFDGSVEEMWMAFSNGATLVVPSKDAPRFGNDLARYLAQQRVTYFTTVPTMLTTMTEPVPSLRQLVLSGEVCRPQLVERWAEPGRLMLNVYGPTETTVNATAAVCERGRPVTIGRPLEGYEALVLDGDMRPLPQGAEGELYIGGPGIARGYLKQPNLTESSFIISPHDGRRLYRTGDLACVNASGELEYFGRIDRQVKIRGFRVELAEIEAVLLEQPHVSSAVAHLHEEEGTQILAAYVVLNAALGSARPGRHSRGLASAAPGLHGPKLLGCGRRAPAAAKRQGGPQIPARTRFRVGRCGKRRHAPCNSAGDHHCLRLGNHLQRAGDRRRAEFLSRPRRAFAHGGADDGAASHPCRARCRGAGRLFLSDRTRARAPHRASAKASAER